MNIRCRPEYYWLLLFAVCFLSFQLVQDHLRPNYHGNEAVVVYLLGSSPNFFPGIGIPALFVVLIPACSNNNRTNTWLNGKRYITANAISIMGLLAWEFAQPFTSKGRFDWHDVLWPLLGALLFHLLWTLAPQRYKATSDAF
jgi:hypothetical protein